MMRWSGSLPVWNYRSQLEVIAAERTKPAADRR